MTALRLRAGGATDVGRVRQVNQDSHLLLEDRGLYVVADGMGGHQGGEVASQLAVAALRTAYAAGDGDALADAIEEANLQIHERGEADPQLQGMGTTVVAVAVQPEGDGSLLIANVGDSRAYLFRDGDLTQITEDHSMVADLVREGRITEEEAEVHPQRNIVTRVLGVYDEVDIDLFPVDAVRGDRLLLCSDGLFNEVARDQIAAVLRRLADPQEAADELVRRALEGGGRDNVTVVVVDVLEDGGVAETASQALAGSSGGVASGDDLAGFSSARSADEDTGEHVVVPPPRLRRGRRRPTVVDQPVEARRSRLTWRVVAFAVLLVAIVGGAFATIQWYGTHAWYVGFDRDVVTLYQGRPGGVLWIEPKEVDDDLHLTREDLTSGSAARVEEEHQQSTRADAERFLENLQTTTTSTSTTTTTLPVDPNATATTVAAPPP